MREPLRGSWSWGGAGAFLAAALAVGPVYGQTGSASNVGYIDSAIPITQFRLRYDVANDDNSPERADFFYSKNAPGPLSDKFVNFQEYYAYAEFAPTPRVSGFIELPYRYLQPDNNSNQNGLGDITFGGKYALIAEEDRVLTFQFVTCTPTADGLRGLGTHNWNIEPAFLYFRRLSERLTLEAELHDFIPVVAYDDFAGNVLRYGVGVGYTAYERPMVRVTPVVEMVGWSVLSGKEDTGSGPVSAAGDTIVNAKFGVRIRFGETPPPDGDEETDGGVGGLNRMPRSDVYIGYGRALTGDVWYKNILRVEYRLRF